MYGLLSRGILLNFSPRVPNATLLFFFFICLPWGIKKTNAFFSFSCLYQSNLHFSMFRISCWMISTLSTVQRAMSLQDQTSSHVILKRTPVHGTTTTLPAFCGKGLKGDFMRDQMRKVSKQELSKVVTDHWFTDLNSHSLIATQHT